jgi:bifunctional non-homologous end joining protein LigD
MGWLPDYSLCGERKGKNGFPKCPQLVANFEFATWTKSGRIRKPATFLGFRKDKKAKDVVREVPKSVDLIEEEIHEPENAAVAKNGRDKKKVIRN